MFCLRTDMSKDEQRKQYLHVCQLYYYKNYHDFPNIIVRQHRKTQTLDYEKTPTSWPYICIDDKQRCQA